MYLKLETRLILKISLMLPEITKWARFLALQLTNLGIQLFISHEQERNPFHERNMNSAH
jgi:hypothetical protein